MTSSNAFIEQMEHWQQLGLLRAIDLYWIKTLAPIAHETHASVLLAGMTVSQALGQGHVCLFLPDLYSKPFAGLLDKSQLTKNNLGLEQDNWQHFLRTHGIQSYQAMRAEIQKSDLVMDLTVPTQMSLEHNSSPMVLVQDRLYLRRYYEFEQTLVDFIQQAQQRPVYDYDPKWLTTLFADRSRAAQIESTEIDWQKMAVANSALQAFSIISGGPGTGKTTTVTKLLALLIIQAHAQNKKLRIELAAPTGKAAARLTESIMAAKAQLNKNDVLSEHVLEQIPEQATTLHRLLGSRFGRSQFIHNKSNPLHLDVLLVDEASMVDLSMMAKLLEALPEHARLILLGDKDQLASVEAGSALADLTYGIEQYFYTENWSAKLNSIAGELSFQPNSDKQIQLAAQGYGRSAYMRQHLSLLTKSYRFSSSSGIGQLASAVNQADSQRSIGLLQNAPQVFDRLSGADDSIAWLPLADKLTEKTKITDPVIEIDKLAEGYQNYWHQVNDCLSKVTEASIAAVFQAFSQYQVLTAVRVGEFGVEQLNQRMQDYFFAQGWITKANSNADQTSSLESLPTWYAGKAVMITRNDSALDLFNGDIGICLPDPAAAARLRVWFELANGEMRGYLPSRLSNYEAVFVMTVHKSQGSEFEHIELVLPTYESAILTRELFYTGITRAKKRFRLWASLTSVKAALTTNVKRYSGLTRLLWPEVGIEMSEPEISKVANTTITQATNHDK